MIWYCTQIDCPSELHLSLHSEVDLSFAKRISKIPIPHIHSILSFALVFLFFFLNIPQRKKWSFLGRCEYTLETGQRGHAESKCKQKVKAPNFTLFFL